MISSSDTSVRRNINYGFKRKDGTTVYASMQATEKDALREIQNLRETGAYDIITKVHDGIGERDLIK